MAQGDGAAERGRRDRSEDRREDHQPGGDAADRADHGELPGRPGRPRLAGDRLQPADADALHAAQRVLLQHHAETARPGPGLYGRRPRDVRARAGPRTATAISGGSRRSSWPTSRLRGRTAARAADQRGTRRPAAVSSSPAHATAASARFDDTTGKVLWQMRTNNAVNSFPISYSVNGKQYIAVAIGDGSGDARSMATLTPEIKNPEGGPMLWVFALPDR